MIGHVLVSISLASVWRIDEAVQEEKKEKS